MRRESRNEDGTVSTSEYDRHLHTLLAGDIPPGSGSVGEQIWGGQATGMEPQMALKPGQLSLTARSLPWPFGIPEAQSSHSLPPTPEEPAPPCPRAQPSWGCSWWDRSGEGWALSLGTVAWRSGSL